MQLRYITTRLDIFFFPAMNFSGRDFSSWLGKRRQESSGPGDSSSQPRRRFKSVATRRAAPSVCISSTDSGDSSPRAGSPIAATPLMTYGSSPRSPAHPSRSSYDIPEPSNIPPGPELSNIPPAPEPFRPGWGITESDSVLNGSTAAALGSGCQLPADQLRFRSKTSSTLAEDIYRSGLEVSFKFVYLNV